MTSLYLKYDIVEEDLSPIQQETLLTIGLYHFVNYAVKTENSILLKSLEKLSDNELSCIFSIIPDKEDNFLGSLLLALEFNFSYVIKTIARILTRYKISANIPFADYVEDKDKRKLLSLLWSLIKIKKNYQ